MGDRKVIEGSVRWKKGRTLDRDWQIEEGHVIQIDGMPTVRARPQYLPPPAEYEEFKLCVALGRLPHELDALPEETYRLWQAFLPAYEAERRQGRLGA